jgi:hypothetical protein
VLHAWEGCSMTLRRQGGFSGCTCLVAADLFLTAVARGSRISVSRSVMPTFAAMAAVDLELL